VTRQFAALRMDHEGRFAVRVAIDGPLGAATVTSAVDATYDLRPPPVLFAGLPGAVRRARALMGVKLLRRRRSPQLQRQTQGPIQCPPRRALDWSWLELLLGEDLLLVGQDRLLVGRRSSSGSPAPCPACPVGQDLLLVLLDLALVGLDPLLVGEHRRLILQDRLLVGDARLFRPCSGSFAVSVTARVRQAGTAWRDAARV
jgi:hypothetical protein